MNKRHSVEQVVRKLRDLKEKRTAGTDLTGRCLAAEVLANEHVFLGLGEDHPLPVARFYERDNSIDHRIPPMVLVESCGEMISSSGKYVP